MSWPSRVQGRRPFRGPDGPYNRVCEGAMKEHPNTPSLPTACPPESPPKAPSRRRHRASRPQLLTTTQLDGRTTAAKEFDRLVADIENDLSGSDRLSAIERALVEGFAGAAVTLQHWNTQLALGQPIDLFQHAQAVSAMVRVASRLGLQPRARDVLARQPSPSCLRAALRFETDPVVTVRENFVACALAITARHGQPAISTYRRIRAAECRTSGPYLRKPRVIYLFLSRRHDHAVQMDTRESTVEIIRKIR